MHPIVLFTALVTSAAHAAPVAGMAHVTLSGAVNAAFDIAVKDCVVMPAGASFVSGLTFNMPRGEMIASGIVQIAAYAGDKTYDRPDPASKAIRFSLQVHKAASDAKIY